jgi:hypothetical protein
MKLFNLEIASKKIAFVLIFSALGLLLHQFNFSEIAGVVGLESQPYFTYFQFMGPIAGGIMGPLAGILSVFVVAVLNFFLTGQLLSLPVVVSFFTMSAAVLYFSNKVKWDVFIPTFCMLLFWMHPIGADAWYYALFWLIPILAVFLKSNILIRSLGATFTAHSIGSVAYLYAFNIPAIEWAALMFVTPIERLFFAAGITVFYYAVNTALSAFSSKVDFSFLNIEKKYALWRA